MGNLLVKNLDLKKHQALALTTLTILKIRQLFKPWLLKDIDKIRLDLGTSVSSRWEME